MHVNVKWLNGEEWRLGHIGVKDVKSISPNRRHIHVKDADTGYVHNVQINQVKLFMKFVLVEHEEGSSPRNVSLSLPVCKWSDLLKPLSLLEPYFEKLWGTIEVEIYDIFMRRYTHDESRIQYTSAIFVENADNFDREKDVNSWMMNDAGVYLIGPVVFFNTVHIPMTAPRGEVLDGVFIDPPGCETVLECLHFFMECKKEFKTSMREQKGVEYPDTGEPENNFAPILMQTIGIQECGIAEYDPVTHDIKKRTFSAALISSVNDPFPRTTYDEIMDKYRVFNVHTIKKRMRDMLQTRRQIAAKEAKKKKENKRKHDQRKKKKALVSAKPEPESAPAPEKPANTLQECMVCLVEFETSNFIHLECKHEMCSECYPWWKSSCEESGYSFTCPMCRNIID